MIRPMAGIGIAHVSVEVCYDIGFAPIAGSCVDGSDSDLGVSIGALAHYFSGTWMFGPELKILILPGEDAFVLGGHAGVFF